MDKAQNIHFKLNKYVLVAILAFAFWPVLVWYVARTLDRSDEPWGLLSLATAVLLLLVKGGRKAASFPQCDPTRENLSKGKPSDSVVAGIATLLVYIGTYHFAPHLVQSILFILAFWFLLLEKFPMPSRSGIFGLLILALPVVPSLNFYAGYPVRFIVAAGASLLLSVLGLPATQEGTLLSLNQHLISIDAPCGGIHMLWTEAYAVMLLASLFGLTLRKTTLLTLSAGVLITVGNVLRASTLIIYDVIQWRHPDSAISQMEPLVHVSIGLFYFCLVTGITAFYAQKLACEAKETPSGIAETLVDCKITAAKVPRVFQHDLVYRTLLVLCVLSASLPLLAHPTTGAERADPSPSWPAKINGETVTPIAALKEEEAFASDFPGYMKRFTDGSSAYFVRCVYKDTRQLHPSSDCFRGLGYSVEPRPLIVGKDGQRWSSFDATKSMQKYLVMERIHDSQGKSWTDVSEWYWAASCGESTGPWFAITIAKPTGFDK